MTTVNAILAHDENFGIGKDNGLPWPKSNLDMKWFKKHTQDSVVVMGRKTWESLGNRKLPGRFNVVISNSGVNGNPDLVLGGADVSKTIEKIEAQFKDKNIWFIGGANLYSQVISICDYVYISKFDGSYDCDVFFDPTPHLADFYLNLKFKSGGITFEIWRQE